MTDMRGVMLAHMEAGHMFNVPEPPTVEPDSLVPLPDLCPACGSPLRSVSTWQLTLFLGCSIDATYASNIRLCNGCGWWIATGEDMVSPRGFR